MSVLSDLAPQKVWEFFELISSIPHPSGHEKALSDRLKELAENAGLKVKQDHLGNLRIDREAAPGFENAPLVILQGHLDMVPVSNKEFDFTTTPITLIRDGEWVRADGTTLGADDGIGVALILALLFDETLECGAFAGLFTVSEETGMDGAAGLDKTMLQGDYLINCDGSHDYFCVSSAGGARQEFNFKPEYVACEAQNGIKITLNGLPGGHSGCCIHDDRGNALIFLAEFLDMHPEISLADFSGGSVDNAIPDTASIWGATNENIQSLQQQSDAFVLLTAANCSGAKNMRILIEKAPRPEKVLQKEFRSKFIQAVALVPNGVIEMDDKLNVVKTSSNLAAIHCSLEKIIIRTSQRSMMDECRENISDILKEHFALFGAESKIENPYPASPPKMDSKLLKIFETVKKRAGQPFLTGAMHAGLETGWFAKKAPELEILATGINMVDYHTPHERVLIKSVVEVEQFLRESLQEIARQS